MTQQQSTDLFVEDTDDAREEAMRVLRGRGLRAAVTAAIEVCEAKDAPAPAKATAAGWIFRMTGLDGTKSPEEKEPSQMSADELFAAARDAKARLGKAGIAQAAEPLVPQKRNRGGVFE